MPFVTRAVIALLAGVGAGLLGFWVVWTLVWKLAGEHPGIGHDAWLLAGIFVPGVLVPLAVFRIVSRATARGPAETAP
jgi:hypothetical protein